MKSVTLTWILPNYSFFIFYDTVRLDLLGPLFVLPDSIEKHILQSSSTEDTFENSVKLYGCALRQSNIMVDFTKYLIQMKTMKMQ